jgi:bifunctional aspartokinase / homoserine dehydrogenase 1
MKKQLQVMKFGGTSVGNASCIARVAELIRTASRESSVAVVVSAMSGVTNKLIEAANLAQAGNESAVSEIFVRLAKQHDEVVKTLVHSAAERERLRSKLHGLLAEGGRFCQSTFLSRQLTPRTLDAISGLGERLCAPLVAAALVEIGVCSEAMDATELIVTDSNHGGAEPRVDLTRARCQARVVPVLRKNSVPVMTGFIGATEEGVFTTLGRGGSDYSATILGTALDADEVVIWSDVHGLLTADPKLVADASTIPEVSYREAAELAYFGAKVLHPKTLRPVMQRGIPLRIRNTFAADEPGTRITPSVPLNAQPVTGLAAVQSATLITVSGNTKNGVQGTRQDISNTLARTLAAATAIGAEVLLISQSSSDKDIFLVIGSPLGERVVEMLRQQLSADRPQEKTKNVVFTSSVSLLTVVGRNLRTASGTVARAFAALTQENVNIIASVQGSSDCSLSFVIPQTEMTIAVAALHRELELERLPLSKRPVASVAGPSAIRYESEEATAD